MYLKPSNIQSYIDFSFKISNTATLIFILISHSQQGNNHPGMVALLNSNLLVSYWGMTKSV